MFQEILIPDIISSSSCSELVFSPWLNNFWCWGYFFADLCLIFDSKRVWHNWNDYVNFLWVSSLLWEKMKSTQETAGWAEFSWELYGNCIGRRAGLKGSRHCLSSCHRIFWYYLLVGLVMEICSLETKDAVARHAPERHQRPAGGQVPVFIISVRGYFVYCTTPHCPSWSYTLA